MNLDWRANCKGQRILAREGTHVRPRAVERAASSYVQDCRWPGAWSGGTGARRTWSGGPDHWCSGPTSSRPRLRPDHRGRPCCALRPERQPQRTVGSHFGDGRPAFSAEAAASPSRRCRRRRQSWSSSMARRFHGRGARIRHRLGARQVTPRPDQCDRQSGIRVPGVRGRRRLHLGPKIAASTSSRPGPMTRSSTGGRSTVPADEETGELWCPRPPRSAMSGSYVARHGRGYSRFEHSAHGVDLQLLQFVPLTDPSRCRAAHRNTSAAPSPVVTGYVEWSWFIARRRRAVHDTAPIRSPARSWPVTRGTGIRLARRLRRPGRLQASWTGDRREFIGRNGSLAAPAALVARGPLSGALGPASTVCSPASRDRAAAGRRFEVLFLLAMPPTMRKRNPSSAVTEAPISRPSWPRCAGIGPILALCR